MDTPDINHVLKVYLGIDVTGGFQPIGCDERLEAAFPNDHFRLMQLISPYLRVDHVADWSKNGLEEEAELFALELWRKFPELDDVSIRALVNRWSFGNR
jgi:hypothetical protein